MLKNPAEKKLFVTLWALIGIATSIWFFLPKEHPLPTRSLPSVHLAPELTAILAAKVSKWEDTKFELEYAPTSDYVAKLAGQEKDLEVRYELRNETRTVGTGITVLHLASGPSQITIPNEDRRVASTVFLFLPR